MLMTGDKGYVKGAKMEVGYLEYIGYMCEGGDYASKARGMGLTHTN